MSLFSAALAESSCVQPKLFPEQSMFIQSKLVQQRCEADCWSFGLHSSLVLHMEMILAKLGPGGIVGIRKLEKEEAVRAIDQMAVIEGGKNESQD